MPLRTIPVISNPSELQQYLAQISTGVGRLLNRPRTPKIPFNFKLTTKQGGNLLEWAASPEADGYRLEISTSGDFSSGNFTPVILGSQAAVSYFDSVPTQGGTAPGKRFYRLRALAGTQAQIHSVEGLPTSIVSGTAIAPNDTVTASSATRDSTTADIEQRATRGGDYGGDYTPGR